MWALFIKGFVTVCLLAAAFHFVNFSDFILVLRQSDINYIILAFIIQFVLSVPQALRWRLILKHEGVSVKRLSAWYNVLLGLLFNQVLPSSLGGDAIRIYEALNLDLRIVFESVLFDRLFALFSLSILCLFLLLFFIQPIAEFTLFKSMFAIVCFTICGILILACIGPAVRYFNFLDKPIVARLVSVCDNFRNLIFSGTICFEVIVLSLIIHIFVIISGILIFVGIGVNFSFVEIGAIFALVNLFSVLPISVGGWGLREGLSIFLFAIVNVNYEQALAASMIFGVVMLAVGVLGGALWTVFGRKGEW